MKLYLVFILPAGWREHKKNRVKKYTGKDIFYRAKNNADHELHGRRFKAKGLLFFSCSFSLFLLSYSPELVSDGFPFLSIFHALAAEMLACLGRLKIRRHGTGLMNKFLEDLRVFQHGAGAKMVAVERLSLSVGFEKRLLETLNKRFFMYIRS